MKNFIIIVLFLFSTSLYADEDAIGVIKGRDLEGNPVHEKTVRDGRSNIRYILMDMTHPAYFGAIKKFTAMHVAKEAGNKLTVLPNLAGTQAIVKVVAQVGWAQNEHGYLRGGKASGLIIKVMSYSDLLEVHDYLRSPEWLDPNDTL